tara:strand:- start:56 stop:256 length:201 start_codon:yes stop_codon:yes gene_type:complete
VAFEQRLYPDINLAILPNIGKMTLREDREQIEALLSDPEYKPGHENYPRHDSSHSPSGMRFEYFSQ